MPMMMIVSRRWWRSDDWKVFAWIDHLVTGVDCWWTWRQGDVVPVVLRRRRRSRATTHVVHWELSAGAVAAIASSSFRCHAVGLVVGVVDWCGSGTGVVHVAGGSGRHGVGRRR